MAALAVLCAALGSARVDARCADDIVTVWPPRGTLLPANAEIVVSVHRPTDEGKVRKFVDGAFLEGNDERVPLGVTSELRGAGLRQFVLVPSHPLKVGATYRLRLMGDPRLEMWPIDDEWPPSWPVTAASTRPPEWRSPPAFAGSGVDPSTFVCATGPTVLVKASVQSTTPTQALVWLRPLTPDGEPSDGRWVDWVGGPLRLPVVEGELNLGHEPCLGGFGWPLRIARYRASILLVDVAGNRSTPQEIEIDSPRPRVPELEDLPPHVRPVRAGNVTYRIVVAAKASDTDAVERVVKARFNRLGLRSLVRSRRGGVLEFEVQTQPRATPWLVDLLRPGEFELARTVDYAWPRQVGVPEGISQRSSSGRFKSEDPELLNRFLSRLRSPEGIELRAACEPGDSGGPQRCESVATEGRLATNSGIEGAEAMNASPLWRPGLGVEVRFTRQVMDVLTQAIGHEPFLVVLDGQIVARAARIQVPFESVFVHTSDASTGPADILEAVLASGPLVGAEIRAVTVVE